MILSQRIFKEGFVSGDSFVIYYVPTIQELIQRQKLYHIILNLCWMLLNFCLSFGKKWDMGMKVSIDEHNIWCQGINEQNSNKIQT